MTSTVTYRTLCRRCVRYALIGHAYRRWYRVARAVLGRLADHYDVDYGTLCDVVAVCSPRTSAKRNLRFAVAEITGRGRPSDMIRSTRAALDHYSRTKQIRGPKTSRFSDVLRGADNVVVVDTWMARALSVPDRQARSRTCQMLAERVIEHVARRFGWCLSDAQAAVWAGVIRTHYKDGTVPIYRTEDVGLYRTGPERSLSDTPF